MIVVAIMSVGCAFIFVTRFHSSKDAYDMTNSTVDPTSESQVRVQRVVRMKVKILTQRTMQNLRR